MKRLCALLCLITAFVFGISNSVAESIIIDKNLGFDIEAPSIENYQGENLADYGNWELAYFVDEFYEPTNEMYVRNKKPFKGLFDNDAVNDKDLSAYVFVDLNVNASVANPENFFVWFRLLEYGEFRLKNTTDEGKMYNIRVMDADGTKYVFEGYMNPQQDYITPINSTECYKLIQILQKGGTIRFVITDPENDFVNYRFTIEDATGFASAYAREIVFPDPVASRIQGMYYSADEWFESDEKSALLLYALLEESGHLEEFIKNENVEDAFILNYGTNFAVWATFGEGSLGYIFFPGDEPLSALHQVSENLHWTQEWIDGLNTPYRRIDTEAWLKCLESVAE